MRIRNDVEYCCCACLSAPLLNVASETCTVLRYGNSVRIVEVTVPSDADWVGFAISSCCDGDCVREEVGRELSLRLAFSN